MAIQIKPITCEADVQKYLKHIQTLIETDTLDQAAIIKTQLLESLKDRQQFLHLIPSQDTETLLEKLITQDDTMLSIKRFIRILAREKDAVLIVGESGTGKEILARALHGSRRGQFIPFNCAAMPQELIESELFGHIQGAFTGANGMKMGLFEAARFGTIFLDEIGDLPLLAQAKLLRFLQDKKVRKVGGVEEIQVDVRVVCATHHNMEELVNEKKFRLDLYSRIHTFPIITKPLRFRRGDIEMIVNALSTKGHEINRVLNSTENLREYSYPSNVRDLQRFCRQYEVLGRIL